MTTVIGNAGELVVLPASELLSRAKKGDADAFGALLSGPLLQRAFRVAAAILTDTGEAEDAVQEATERAWRHLGRVADPGAFDGWYMTIVRNQSLSRLGGTWRTRVLTLGLTFDHADRRHDHDQEHTPDLRAALRRLEPTQRAVLVLRFYWGMSLDEIAMATGSPLGTVKSRLSRGTERLRQLLAAT